MIRARAPGKVVLWGEYAVLAGAPALVQAVDRYAVCTLASAREGWRFESRGFAAPAATVTLERLLDDRPPGPEQSWLTAWHVLRALGTDGLPAGAQLGTDTRGFYHGASKLGLGSSAAVTVACYGTFCELLGRTPDYVTALQIHHALQHGHGSGIDIAAAFFGGLLRFERPREPAFVRTPAAWCWPEALHTAYIWTGLAARTTDHLRRFERWRAGGDNRALDALGAASHALFERSDTLSALGDYVRCLKDLDDTAQLGVYGAAHRQLDQLAIAGAVVYKPCGAGGGDLGIAVAEDPEALRAFVRRATASNFTPISLETALDGIQVTR